MRRGYSRLISPAGGWKAMGMESYGAGDNREFSLALYAALNVKETNDEGMKAKGLELERPDGDGGTERNQLYCIKPSAEMEAMGFRGIYGMELAFFAGSQWDSNYNANYVLDPNEVAASNTQFVSTDGGPEVNPSCWDFIVSQMVK